MTQAGRHKFCWRYALITREILDACHFPDELAKILWIFIQSYKVLGCFSFRSARTHVGTWRWCLHVGWCLVRSCCRHCNCSACALDALQSLLLACRSKGAMSIDCLTIGVFSSNLHACLWDDVFIRDASYCFMLVAADSGTSGLSAVITYYRQTYIPTALLSCGTESQVYLVLGSYLKLIIIISAWQLDNRKNLLHHILSHSS